jgi:hypothetical protein
MDALKLAAICLNGVLLSVIVYQLVVRADQRVISPTAARIVVVAMLAGTLVLAVAGLIQMLRQGIA